MKYRLSWLGVSLGVLLLGAPSLFSRVLWWENLEDSTLARMSWSGQVSLEYDPPYVQDDPAGFRRQNHGLVSLRLEGLADDSTWVRWPALAQGVPLALLEVYVNLPEAGLETALWRLGRLDVEILALGTSRYALRVSDALGSHLFSEDTLILVPDTVVHPQNWYRLQVLFTDTLDYLFINGYRVGQGFLPRDTLLPDSVTWVIPAGNLGSLLLDDYVVSVPDTGLHPNLLFAPEDIPILLAKTTDTYTGTSGIAPAELWDTIAVRAQRYLNTDTLVLLDGEVRYPYPFPWPPPLWSGLLYQAYIPQWVQFEGFVYALTGDTAHAHKVRNILWSLSNWPQLEWPFYYHNPTPLYMETDGFHYLLVLTLGYDLVYNALSDVDRMSIENAILVKGVQQADLSLRIGNLSRRPVRSNKALVGATALLLACLTVEDSAYTAEPRSVAIQTFEDFFSHPEESFNPTTGDARENSFYASYALAHVALAAEALERRGQSRLREALTPFVRYRASLALPGLRSYPPVGDNSAVLYGFMEQTPELLAYLASRSHNALAQWYLAGISSYTFDYGQGLWGDYIHFGTFLWLDNTQPTASPADLGLPRVQRFPVVGLAMYRSGWQDPRSLTVFLKSRDAGAYHNHLDNNTLFLGLGDRWLVGEDTYRHLPYTERHSTLWVFYQNDTLGQVGRADGGTLRDPFQDSVSVLLEGEAQGSYQTVSLFRRRVWILPADTLVVVWDRIESPETYPARYQLRYHLFGTPYWQGDTLNLLQDSLHLRMLWRSAFATHQGLEFRPTDTVWTITSLHDSTEFEGAAIFDLSAAVSEFPEPFQTQVGHGFRYLHHRLLEVEAAYRDSFQLPENHGTQAYWLLLNLRPNTSYALAYAGDSTAGYDTLTTDGYGRASFVLQAPEDTLEVYVFWRGKPQAPTRPVVPNRIHGETPALEWWTYEVHHQVFAVETRHQNTYWLDFGEMPTITHTHTPRVAYYQRRRGRWNLTLRNVENSEDWVLNTWPDSSEIRRYPPVLLAESSDTLWLVHWIARADSQAWLLGYRLLGTSVEIDTLATSPLAPSPYSVPSLARTPEDLWMAWFQPVGISHLLLVAPGFTKAPPETVAVLTDPGNGPTLLADQHRLYVAWETEGSVWYSLREGGLWRPPELVDSSVGHPVFLSPQHLLVSTFGKRPTVVLYTFNGARFSRDLNVSPEGSGWYGTGRVISESHGAYETQVLWSDVNGAPYLRDTLLHLRPRTFVNGRISGLTFWRDTVYVNGDILVDSAAVLRILPGTVVQITPHFDYLQTGRDPQATEIVVQGTLVAYGEHRNPVTFQGEGTPGSWLGLRVEPGGTDTLVNVHLLDAEHGVVALAGTEIFLDSVHMIQLSGWSVYAQGATVEILNGYLYGPWGIALDQCHGRVQGNTLRGQPHALTVRDPSGYLLVQKNSVFVVGPVGFLLENTGRRVDLFQNTVYGADIGLLLINSSPLMDQNRIFLSQVASVWTVGNSQPRLYRNFLHARRLTVVATDGSRPLLGEDSDSHSGNNTVVGDSLRVAYVPTGPTAAPLRAENNWWGTTTPGPSLFLGPVDYVPYLQGPPEAFSQGSAQPLQATIPTLVRRTLRVRLASPVDQSLTYAVYDITGRQVVRGLWPLSSLEIRIPVAHLPAGVYFLTLWDPHESVVLHRRFVKL